MNPPMGGLGGLMGEGGDGGIGGDGSIGGDGGDGCRVVDSCTSRARTRTRF